MLADFKQGGHWIEGQTVAGKWTRTLSGNVWRCMMHRCKASRDQTKGKPAYYDCTVSDEFRDFQRFATWYTSQIGYGLGYEMDKDFLSGGSKVYSGETCVLIPHELNAFIKPKLPRKALALPVGVYYLPSSGKFRAMIGIGNKLKSLGTYFTADSAEKAYKDAKRAETLHWIARVEQGEFEVDQRIVEGLRRLT